MRKFNFYIILLSFCFISLFSIECLGQYSSTRLVKIETDQIEISRIQTAKNMAHKLLEGMRNRDFYVLTKDEAITKLRNEFTASRQAKFYQNITKYLGDYEGGFDLHEAYQVVKPDADDLIMYRFKGGFPRPTEIRVYYQLNEELMSGIVVTYWIDDIYRYDKTNSNGSN